MPSMYRPASLKPGDTIGIVCTARKITLEEIDTAVKTIENWGFKVRIGDNIGAEDCQYAGSDDVRSSAIQKLLDDPEVKAIICAKGGYGTVRVLDRLDFTKFMHEPKWIAGFSDVTVLHVHLNNLLGMQSIHSPMLSTFASSTPEALLSLKDALIGNKVEYPETPHALNIDGYGKGKMMGGNLSLLYSLTGTQTQLHTAGNILFLEDLDEYLYHIDRMMQNLLRSGKLKGLAGLVVGGMTDMKDNAIPFGKNANEIIFEYAEPLGIPVCFGFPAGHISDNRALLMGREASLSVRNGIGKLEWI